MNFLNPTDIILANRFNTQQAMIYQRQWASLLSQDDQNKTIETVAGVDVAYDKATNQAFAVAVVIDANSLAFETYKKRSQRLLFPTAQGFYRFAKYRQSARRLIS
nr:endonuclease V [Legionella tunisiensis]